MTKEEKSPFRSAPDPVEVDGYETNQSKNTTYL